MWSRQRFLRMNYEGASRRCPSERVANLWMSDGLLWPTNAKTSSLLLRFPQIQHSSTIIDLPLQLTARFVPNQFLSPPLFLYRSLRISLPPFFTSLPCVPRWPPPSHVSTSHPKVSGVTPSKVIRKQQLPEKSILYQQATTGFCTYPIWSLW